MTSPMSVATARVLLSGEKASEQTLIIAGIWANLSFNWPVATSQTADPIKLKSGRQQRSVG